MSMWGSARWENENAESIALFFFAPIIRYFLSTFANNVEEFFSSLFVL